MVTTQMNPENTMLRETNHKKKKTFVHLHKKFKIGRYIEVKNRLGLAQGRENWGKTGSQTDSSGE